MNNVSKEAKLLKIRNLIVQQEMIVATANRELHMGDWRGDWSECVNELQEMIDKLFDEVNLG